MTAEEKPREAETLAEYAPFRKKAEEPPHPTATEARQAVTGHGVRYVLAASLALSLIALFLVWAHVI